jgi:hypothetical protein
MVCGECVTMQNDTLNNKSGGKAPTIVYWSWLFLMIINVDNTDIHQRYNIDTQWFNNRVNIKTRIMLI